MDVIFGTWNVRSLYRARSLITVASEISNYKLDLVGVQEIGWDRDGIERAGEYTCSYGKGNENRELGTGLFVHRRIISAVKRAEFVSDRMSCVRVRGLWGDIVVLNVHAPTEDKIDEVESSLYKELKPVFDKFHKYHFQGTLHHKSVWCVFPRHTLVEVSVV
jgi:exonuclease III